MNSESVSHSCPDPTIRRTLDVITNFLPLAGVAFGQGTVGFSVSAPTARSVFMQTHETAIQCAERTLLRIPRTTTDYYWDDVLLMILRTNS